MPTAALALVFAVFCGFYPSRDDTVRLIQPGIVGKLRHVFARQANCVDNDA